ncbi:unnamed protein product [Moneuplotes crassus]|uniref:Uncharacterized protein n=1 Tax=Euplotes crassus TaxID=5936 RepID=A0AAD2D0P1_EUPCR|nr:unnamed protein product [Moneuplotes crassus]
MHSESLIALTCLYASKKLTKQYSLIIGFFSGSTNLSWLPKQKPQSETLVCTLLLTSVNQFMKGIICTIYSPELNSKLLIFVGNKPFRIDYTSFGWSSKIFNSLTSFRLARVIFCSFLES